MKRRSVDIQIKRQLKPQTPSVHLDVSFLAQTSQPAFLLGVRFFRDQFFLNLFAYFGEGARDAAAFIFDFENIIIAAELDDVADFSGSQVERDFLERRRQGADRKSTRLNSSHLVISYAVFCLKKK